jgi:hypothetical protein
VHCDVRPIKLNGKTHPSQLFNFQSCESAVFSFSEPIGVCLASLRVALQLSKNPPKTCCHNAEGLVHTYFLLVFPVELLTLARILFSEKLLQDWSLYIDSM